MASRTDGIYLEGAAAEANRLLNQAQEAGRIWIQFAEIELECEAQRPVVLERVKQRLLATENADTKKPHSATSALEAAKIDPEYLALLAKKSHAVAEKDRCRVTYEVELERARLYRDVYRKSHVVEGAAV